MRSKILFIVFISFLTLHALTSQSQVYDYERQSVVFRGHRDGKEVDDFREIGKAQVTASPILRDGIRLKSLDEHGIAVAVYIIEADNIQANSLVITVDYIASTKDEVGGKVFVLKNTEEKQLHGATFTLRADRRREKLHLIDARRYIHDGQVEIHLVADNEQTLDVKSIEVEGLRYKPEIRIVQSHCCLPRAWYRTYYWHYYVGPVYYAIEKPYNYIVYRSWWYKSYYREWSAEVYVQALTTYSVRYYRYYWRPERRVYAHYYGSNLTVTVVRNLPQPREPVNYIKTQQRRRSYSQDRQRLVSRVNSQHSERRTVTQNTQQFKRRRSSEDLRDLIHKADRKQNFIKSNSSCSSTPLHRAPSVQSSRMRERRINYSRFVYRTPPPSVIIKKRRSSSFVISSNKDEKKKRRRIFRR